jgi:hypothetical protein
MWSAAVVVVCALDLLGRSAGTFPPIELVDVAPPGASPFVEGFVQPGREAIYLVTSSPAFRAARASGQRCGDRSAVRKIASVIVHEEWHLRHGPDERGAYQAQLSALLTMGADFTTPVFAEVSRAMRTVTTRRRAPVQTPPTVLLAHRDGPRR